MSNFHRVAWNPKERVARKASYCDNHFGPHDYGVRFDGDEKVYRPAEVEIPLDLVLVPQQEISDLREQLRISQENVRFLQMQFFLVEGKIDEASEALGKALAAEKGNGPTLQAQE